MNSETLRLKNYTHFFAVLLFAVLALPLVALAWFNVPSAADDFCFALNTIKFGFWQGQRYYYDGWTGRYFSTFVMHANPLVWGWLGWYKVFPLLTLGGLFHATYRCVRVLTQATPLQAIGAASGLLFLYLFALPSTVEAFFWMPSVAGYTLPTILLNYAVVMIAQGYCAASARTSLAKLRLLGLGFLIFAIVGSNETPMLGLFVLLGSMAGLSFLKTYRLPLGWWWALAVLLISVYLELSAPGNKVRMSYNPISGLLVPSLVSSLQDVGMAMTDWLIHTPLLIFTALFLFKAHQWFSPHTTPFFAVHPLLSLSIWIGILVLSVFPGYYGVGIPPPPRTMNLVYWFFLTGWFYNMFVLLRFSKQHWGFVPASVPLYTQVMMGIFVLIMLARSQNIRPLYGDLLKGRAKQYHAEMTTRFDKIRQEKNLPLVRVDTLSVRPKTLFTEDINPNPKHLWNTCQAEYWGLKQIKLGE